MSTSTSFTGQVRALRAFKKHSFVILGYGKEFSVQCVIPAELAKDLTEQSFVTFTGALRDLPTGAFTTCTIQKELHVSKVDVHSLADADFSQRCPPNAGAEVRLAQRHLYFRDPTFTHVMSAHAALLSALRAHFSDQGSMEISPPPFVGTECEGGATLFALEHPGTSTDKPMKAYLTQSSQFALEFMLPGLGDVHTIADSFRAEHSHTRRHLTTFLHAECEWGNVGTMEDHIWRIQTLLVGTLTRFLQLGETPLRALKKYERVQHLLDMCCDPLILDHKDAIRMLNEKGIEKEPGVPFGERDDIPEAQERALVDGLDRIVFLVRFPREFKSFYMALDPSDESRVLGLDVEVPGVGEIIGSGVREGDANRLVARLKEAGLDPADYSEYIDLRRYGFCQTSGMGLGVGRMLTWLLEVNSIREVTAFPRFPGYLRP